MIVPESPRFSSLHLIKVTDLIEILLKLFASALVIVSFTSNLAQDLVELLHLKIE